MLLPLHVDVVHLLDSLPTSFDNKKNYRCMLCCFSKYSENISNMFGNIRNEVFDNVGKFYVHTSLYVCMLSSTSYLMSP